MPGDTWVLLDTRRTVGDHYGMAHDAGVGMTHGPPLAETMADDVTGRPLGERTPGGRLNFLKETRS